MAAFTYTFMPTLITLRNGGAIGLKELAAKLNEESIRHFPDLPSVERAITNYAGCLKIEDGDSVRFNREAKSYARDGTMEREIDTLLHEEVRDMKRFQLYEHKSPRNSSTCPIGVPWRNIPANKKLEKAGRDPYKECDFRGYGVEGCRLGCGVKKEVLRKLGIKMSKRIL